MLKAALVGRFAGVAAAAALLVCAGTASAQGSMFQGTEIDITNGAAVQSLVGNHFVVDDKVFEITIFQPTGQADSGTDMATVFPVDEGRLNGVGFEMVGAWIDQPGNGPSGFFLEYMVTVIDPDWYIVDNVLTFNGFAVGDASEATVNETVEDASGVLIGEKEVFAQAAIPEMDWVLSDRLEFDPQKKLIIRKDFLLFSGEGGLADASFIKQTFSQIPAPSSLALLGAMGLIARGRRR